MTERTLRWGALAGTIHVVLILVGNSLATSGETGRTDAVSILTDVRNSAHLVNQVGLVLEVVGFMFFFVFLAALYRVLRLAEGPLGWLAGLACSAGLVSLAVKIGSGAPVIAATYRRDELTPALARTLVDIGGAAFIISGLLTAVFVLAASMSARGSGVLPRWLSTGGLVAGGVGLVTPLVGVVSPDAYVPIPFLLCLLWVACTGVVLARQPLHRTQPTQSDTNPAPGPLTASA
jgi:hypothetical protein